VDEDIEYDFRQINQKILDYHCHNIPEITDVKLRMGNKRIFSAFDIASAYWRVEIDEESKPLTGFIVNEGQFNGTYEYNCMPFGVKSAVSLFSRVMDDCFRGFKPHGVHWYLDDIIQGSGESYMSKEEALTLHVDDLNRLFGRAASLGFTFSIEKSIVAVEFIEYLGYNIGQGICKPGKKTLEKMNKIRNMAIITEPKKKFEKVLGFFNYSRSFIKHFARGQRSIMKMKNYFDEIKEKCTKFNKTTSPVKTPEDVVAIGNSLQIKIFFHIRSLDFMYRQW